MYMHMIKLQCLFVVHHAPIQDGNLLSHVGGNLGRLRSLGSPAEVRIQDGKAIIGMKHDRV